MKVFKIRTKQSTGKIPKGLELQVATSDSNKSSPMRKELIEALVRAVGCKENEANNYFAYNGNYEVIK